MKIKGIDILGRAAGVLLGLFCLVGIFPRCANTAAPMGGPKDSLPPYVVKMTPADMTTEFTGRKIFIEFDEYVQLKDITQEFFVSPALKRMPVVTLRGRGVQIDIHPDDTLKESTTYAFNFGSSIRDNNESNPLYGFRYVMSTGKEIDSMAMSGYTVDAYTKDSLPKTLIFFYDAARDTIPQYDSLIFKGLPDAIGQAENNGMFFAQNLKPVNYRVYAVKDKNNNKLYEPGADMIGVLDSLVNPAEMPSFTICYDTLRKYLVAEPQTYFRMFTDKAFQRHSLRRVERPSQHNVLMVFSAPNADIRSVKFEGFDSTKILREYLRPERDSISFWFNVPSEQLPDTIKGEITFMKHDSLNNLKLDTAAIKAFWKKAAETNDQRREREQAEKEREKLIEQGLKPPKRPNPFKYTAEASNPLNPEKNIVLMFASPLSSIDTSRILLVRYGEEEAMFRVPFTLSQDTINIRQWSIGAKWQEGQKYGLEIPDGVFTNVAEEKNDTLKSQFTVMELDKYGTITVNVKGKTDKSRYVLQLTEAGGKIINEIRNAVTGTYNFFYINPGTVRLRVVEDLDGNGQWNVGDLVNRRQPERVEIYVHEKGELDMPISANWLLKIDLDMAEMFAPITMESVNSDVERQEMARIRKQLERKAEQQKSRQDQQQQGNSQRINTFNPTGGFGL